MLEHKPTETGSNRLPTTFETVPRHVTTCPDCEGNLADGQGLVGCVDCDWYRTVI